MPSGSSAPAPTSSQETGVATSGRSRPRREYGAMVVFDPAFCDQSRKTLPDRRALVMVAVTSLGCSPCSSSATPLASVVESSDGIRRGRSAYRCRPLLPLVTGLARRPRSASLSRTSSATVQHSCRPAGSPGSRSTTSRSALRGRPLRPTVHWWTCSSSAARFTSQVRVARSSTTGKVRVSAPPSRADRAAREPVVGTVTVRTQEGVPAGTFFSKKLALGGPGARVEHLVEVADPQRATLDVDEDLRCLGRAHRPIAMTGTRSASSRAIRPRRKGRGPLTQPAVAPDPLTCRKIPAPRCRTWWELKLVTMEYSYCTG